MTILWLKAQRILLRLKRLWVDWSGRSGQVYFQHRVAEYREMWRQVSLAIGGTFTELAHDLWQVEKQTVVTRINNHQLEFDNPVVLALAGRKSVVHRLLQAEGLRVPEYAVFSLADLQTARQFLRKHPDGCVIKPANGYGGQGVTTHVQDAADVRRAAILASLLDRELLIEAQVPGESYRLLVLDGRMVHAVCRRGPRLTGDGASTIQQLIEADNIRRRRDSRPILDVDRDCLFTLKYQGLALDARPPRGQTFIVKTVNDPERKYTEVRTVYTDTVTTAICDSIRRDAEAAARLVASDFLGVDVITTDPSVSLRQSGGVINEVNTTPALHHHYSADREPYPAVAVLALEGALRRKAERLAVSHG